jgi:hypothetical protein
MDHPKDVGDKSTLAIMLALRLQGYGVLVPFGENTRYDLVIDNGNCLRKVQCKTGRLRNGAVLFAACSSYAHHGSSADPRRDYKGQVDDFAVFCHQLGSVYLIPIEDPGRASTRNVARDATREWPVQEHPTCSDLRDREDRCLLTRRPTGY